MILLFFSFNGFALTKTELEQEGYKNLEKGIESSGLALLEAGVGVYLLTRGDLISGSTTVGAALVQIKDAARNFKEASQNFEKSRQKD